MTNTIRAVLVRAVENGGKIDLNLYIKTFQRGADHAVSLGWMTAPKRGLVYTITDAGRAALAAQPTNA